MRSACAAYLAPFVAATKDENAGETNMYFGMYQTNPRTEDFDPTGVAKFMGECIINKFRGFMNLHKEKSILKCSPSRPVWRRMKTGQAFKVS